MLDGLKDLDLVEHFSLTLVIIWLKLHLKTQNTRVKNVHWINGSLSYYLSFCLSISLFSSLTLVVVWLKLHLKNIKYMSQECAVLYSIGIYA